MEYKEILEKMDEIFLPITRMREHKPEKPLGWSETIALRLKPGELVKDKVTGKVAKVKGGTRITLRRYPKEVEEA
jgi:hypothetical protein